MVKLKNKDILQPAVRASRALEQSENESLGAHPPKTATPADLLSMERTPIAKVALEALPTPVLASVLRMPVKQLDWETCVATATALAHSRKEAEPPARKRIT